MGPSPETWKGELSETFTSGESSHSLLFQHERAIFRSGGPRRKRKLVGAGMHALAPDGPLLLSNSISTLAPAPTFHKKRSFSNTGGLWYLQDLSASSEQADLLRISLA